MLKLKTLQFQNIGRFTEPQTINFESLGSLVQVDGLNNNTGGSSGAGKSSCFAAIDYLLGLNDTPNTVLQSRLTKSPINVTGTFDYDGKSLILSRIKGKLSVELDGEVTVGSNKLAEERLDQILSMPKELFRKILHKRQKEGGFFLEFTPREAHEFLTDCLGLSSFRIKLETLDKKITELEAAKTTKSSKLQAVNAALKAAEDAANALGAAPIKEMHSEVVERLKVNWETSASILALKEVAHKNQITALDQKRPQNTEKPAIHTAIFDRSTLDTASERLKSIEAAMAKLFQDEKDRQNAAKQEIQERKLEVTKLNYTISTGEKSKTDVLRLAAEIKQIRSAICPTCEQNWATDTAKAKEAELLAKLGLHKEHIAQATVAAERLKTLNEEIATLSSVLLVLNPTLSGLPELNEQQMIHTQIILEEKAKSDLFHTEQNKANQAILAQHSAKQQAEQNEFALLQKALREQQTIEITQIRGQTDVDRRTYEAALAKLNAYEDAAKRYQESFDALQLQLHSHSYEKQEVAISLAQLELQLNMAIEAKKAIKSYMSCSFDDALEYIGSAATNMIRSIPNMSNSTISIEGTRETGEGKIKEEVNAVLSSDGELDIPIKSLSGGERSAVDLAVDLAVIDLIESKTGNTANILILDEPFTGLDSANIEMVLEVLKNSNLGKQLIIVDHNDIVKEMVDSKIIVTRTGTTSVVSQ